jgi:hypothetical protein
VGLSTYKNLVAHRELAEVAIGSRGKRLPESQVAQFIADHIAETKDAGGD